MLTQVLLGAQTFDQIIDIASYPIQRVTMPVWVTIGVMIVFSIITYFGWYKRWRKKKEEKAIAEGGRRELAKGALLRVWKDFLAQIPTDFRRAILSYPPVVVLGEAAAGKSVLIGKYTDWKGQSAQFYPSYSQNPMLQIYLGSRSVVQEVPSALLYDYSQSARAALVRLWTPLFRYRDPIVVLAVSANSLKTATPDALRTLAQTFRGKINVLSRIRGKPVKTRIVVTHMDQVEGYLAFSNFLEKTGVQLTLDISSPDAKIESCLEPYEKYLPLALTQLPAKAYMKVLTFLQKAPANLSLLSTLLKTLRENDPLSYEPSITELYLTSDTSGSPSSLSNPFTSAFTGQGILAAAATRHRHRMVATVAVLLGFGALGYGYATERAVWIDAEKAVTRFDATREPRWAKAADQKLAELAGEENAGFSSWVIPRLFGRALDRERDRFTAAMRTAYLLPALERAQNSKGAHGATLYALGVLYGTRDGEVGEFVRRNSGSIGEVLGVPAVMVDAYVRQSRRMWAEPVKLATMPFDRKLSAANDTEPWLAFFIELQQQYDGKSYLTTSDLDKIQSSARGFLESVAEVRRQDSARTIYKLLSTSVAAVDVKTFFAPWIESLEIPEWITANYTQAEALFASLASTRLEVPAVQSASLPAFVYHLRGISAASDKPGNNFRFQLGGKIFTFEGARWKKLVEAGRVRMLVQDFTDGHTGGIDRLLFSEEGRSFSPVVMKPANRGDFVFSGKGAIEGPFTRSAYDREVKPVLLQFLGVVDSLKDTPDLQANLAAFVERAIEAYAADYETSARRYYDAWEIRAESLGGLMILLEQLRLPASSLTEMLDTVNDTTGFVGGAEENASPYLRIIADRLARFQFVNKVLNRERGAPREPGVTATATVKMSSGQAPITEYLKVLSRIYADLQGVTLAERDAEKAEDPKAADAGQTAADFEASLTPVGRAAFMILTEHRDSYRRLAERWLTSAGIEGTWRRPFLAPVNELYALGLSDIEATVRKNWYGRVTPQLTAILGKYPFNPKGEIEALPREVESVLHPNGLFWKAWRNLVAPVCIEEDGVWRPNPAIDARFRWPKDIFPVVNHLSRLTRALFDKSGTPKAVEIEVVARELPAAVAESDAPSVILSFINAGKASVFGFNQKPVRQKLLWEWWSGQAAQAGVQLEDREAEEKFYRQITVQDSMWSLLRLIKRAQVFETDVWTFTLGTGAFGTAKIKFEYKQDPWDYFTIPSAALLIDGGRSDEPGPAMSPGGKNRVK